MLTAAKVMDTSAALLNDFVKADYTYEVQLPFLRLAWNELIEMMASNNIQVTNKVTSGFRIAVGVTDIGGKTGPALPANLIDIENLYERSWGSSELFKEMTKKTYL